MKPIMEVWRDEYIKFDSTYLNHVDKFITYLKLPGVDKANQPTSIVLKDLDNCVGHYVEKGNINSVNSMQSHLESIKAFYNYLINCGYLDRNIVQAASYAKFKDELTEKYNLKECVEREWIQDDDIKLILDRIDNYFYVTDYQILGKSKKERFIHWLCLRLYIKICLLAPAKKSLLLNIKIEDFSNDFRYININQINIKIPNGLRNNIIFTLDFLTDNGYREYLPTDRLFEYIGKVGGEIDKKGTSLNRWFCAFLKEYNILDIPQDNNSYSVELLGNTTLYNMVVQGTNPYYISQISGITISSLESKYYSRIKQIDSLQNVHTELNNSISRCEFYHYI
jgi:hypothetical protein